MSDESCVIRLARDGDLDSLVRLYCAFLDETLEHTPDVLENPVLDAGRVVMRLMHKERTAIIVAEYVNVLAGFSLVEFRRRTDGAWGLRERLTDFLTGRRELQPVILSDRAWLGHLFVTGEHRRKGIAQALLRGACDWARERGAKVLELNVLAANDAARTLYRKLGMSELLVHYRMRL